MTGILWPFFTYSAATAITPGPNNILAMAHGMNYGFARAFRFALGVAAGFFLIIFACCWLNHTLANFLPGARTVLAYLGAAYILYLAVKVALSRPPQGRRKSGEEADEARGDAPRRLALAGFALQFINVKVLLYGLTAASAFIVPATRSPEGFLAYSLAAAMINFACVNLWAGCGSVFQKFIAAWYRPFNVLMAALLAYCALTTAFNA